MTSQPSQRTQNPGPRPISKLSAILLVMTTLAALVALAHMWASQWAVVHIASDATSTIENARRTAFATPLFWVGVSLIALAWIALWRWLRWRHVAIPVVIAIAAALLAGGFFWRSQTVDQPVSVVAYQCAPDENPFSNPDSIRSSCVPDPDAPQVAIGSATDRDAYTLESTSIDCRTRIEGLPTGIYDAYITTTAPSETASIILATENRSGFTPQRLFVQDDRFRGDSGSWSAPLRLSPDTAAYVLLYYLSPEQAVPDARISFTIQQCVNTSPTAFDPTRCVAMTVDDWILQDVASGTGSPTFRQPVRSRDGSRVTYSNLEARTYQFTPQIGNKATTASSYGFLVIPTDEPQISGNNVLSISPDTRQEAFNVEIRPEENDCAFTIYVFPVQNTYAATSAHQHAANVWTILTP